MLAPAWVHAMILGITAAGVVKSITQSKSFSVSFVSAAAPAFSSLVSTWTLWPRAAAISATSEPVLPRPRTSRFISELLESFRIYFGEKFSMKAPDHVRHVAFIDHEADVDLRGALRDHAHVHVGDRSENFSCDARHRADVFAHQANDGLASLVLYIPQLG